jgi:hypothetical protein
VWLLYFSSKKKGDIKCPGVSVPKQKLKKYFFAKAKGK